MLKADIIVKNKQFYCEITEKLVNAAFCGNYFALQGREIYGIIFSKSQRKVGEYMIKVKRTQWTISLLIAILLFTFIMPFSASAEARRVNTASGERQLTSTIALDGRDYRNLLTVNNKNVWGYTRTSVSVGGSQLSVNGLIINGVQYIPFRAAANALGASYTYSSSTRTSTMRLTGLELVASDACYVTYANGRTLFATTPNVIMGDGRLYIPAEIFAKAVGMKLSSSSNGVSISGQVKPLLSADKFYREDEVFWLARIIHAESSGEPLLGQIAVGAVVMNRVKSAYYPNTIYGVIFDRKYGVQFSPILNGAIYNTPSYTARLAAQICLEGYDVTGGAFFFLEPRLATSSWIPRTREYAFTIANHDFYY